MLHDQGKLEAPILGPGNAPILASGRLTAAAVTRGCTRGLDENPIRSLLSRTKLPQPIDPAPFCSRARLGDHGVEGGVGSGIQFTRREPQLNQRSERLRPQSAFVFIRRRA